MNSFSIFSESSSLSTIFIVLVTNFKNCIDSIIVDAFDRNENIIRRTTIALNSMEIARTNY